MDIIDLITLLVVIIIALLILVPFLIKYLQEPKDKEVDKIDTEKRNK